jgi:hypothetical protein
MPSDVLLTREPGSIGTTGGAGAVSASFAGEASSRDELAASASDVTAGGGAEGDASAGAVAAGMSARVLFFVKLRGWTATYDILPSASSEDAGALVCSSTTIGARVMVRFSSCTRATLRGAGSMRLAPNGDDGGASGIDSSLAGAPGIFDSRTSSTCFVTSRQ